MERSQRCPEGQLSSLEQGAPDTSMWHEANVSDASATM